MEPRLELTPHGILICPEPREKWLADFGESEAAGLIQLGGHALPGGTHDPAVGFWKHFAEDYLRALCRRTAEDGDAVPEPSAADLAERVLDAPPMRGGEYLSPDALAAMWRRLDEWVRARIEALGGDPAAFLAQHAPLWSKVGRVTLHLAENKSDPEYPFAFMATYASEVSKSGRVRQLPLGKALQEYAGDKPTLLKLLKPIHAAASRSPLIEELVASGDIFHPLAWLPEEAYRFLRGVPDFEDSGLLVRLPNWWRKRGRRPQVSAVIGERKRGGVGLDALLDFRLEVVVDGESLDAGELESLLAGDDGLVLLRGEWVEVDREKLREALDHWREVARDGGVSMIEGMRLLAGAPGDPAETDESETDRDWAFAEAGDWLAETLDRLRRPEGGGVPDALRATLRPYQEAGMNWLWFCASTGLGACLADDMGLGKTIQLLAALLRKKQQRSDSPPALLIVPASLIGNWKREAATFAPTLDLLVAHRSEQPPDRLADPEALGVDDADLVVTTYSMLTRLDWLATREWSWVVLDEAQAIKNPSAAQSKAVRRLRSAARIALTGTPVENNLGDLWSLFDFLNPGLLGGRTAFRNFVKSLRGSGHDHFAPLRKLVSPYILRRLKTDKSIIADLPEKTEMKVFCGLGAAQATLYQRNAGELERALESAEGIRRRGLVLSYLTRFKQICNHPDQLTKNGDYPPKKSAKFQRLQELCGEIGSRGEKVLVFTQFRELTGPLADCLGSVFGRPGLILHGGVAVKQRGRMVADFQREDGPPFFILSLKAGGTGLNLTAASHVIHFDRWWNPAVENQATDRAFRIGQKRNVIVHKFVTRGTLEEKIDRMIAEKQDTAEQILGQGAEKVLTEMADDELLDLIRLDLDQARHQT
jgi:non-specific serine/threonine protein kinase